MKRSIVSSLAIAVFVSCAHVGPPAATKFSRAIVRGANLEYAVSGRGEPVLLVHGSIFADAYAPILRHPALSRYRLITYHRRGFAGSDRITAPFSISEQGGAS